MQRSRIPWLALMPVTTALLGGCSGDPYPTGSNASPPYFGWAQIIGPGLATLPRSPFSTTRPMTASGGTPLTPVVRREADCSLTEVFIDGQSGTVATTMPHFERQLRTGTGLTIPSVPFPNGCNDDAPGSGARNIAGGRLAGGGAFGATATGNSRGLAVYVTDGNTLVAQYVISLVDGSSSDYVGKMAVADFDGDGHDDYAVEISASGGGTSARLAILLGDGTGHFAAPQFVTVTPGAPTGAVGIAGMTMADFDGDGKPDIAVSTVNVSGVGSITFLKGNGDGTFAPSVAVETGVGADLVAADFDGDGHLDLASGDGHVLLGDGSGHFTPLPNVRFDVGRLAVTDFDGDGHVDVAVNRSTGDGGVIVVWRGDGAGSFTRASTAYGTGYGGVISDLVVGDFNGDGRPDLVVGSGGGGLFGPGLNSQGQTEFLLGRGDGTFAAPPIYEKAIPVVADFDGDALPDLLAWDADQGLAGVRELHGDGTGGFASGPFTALGFSSINALAPPFVVGDFNGDGKADIVGLTNEGAGAVIHTRLGHGDGALDATGPDLGVAFQVPTAGAGIAAKPAVADFDGDGHLDLALVGQGAAQGALYVLHGNGDGAFGAPQTIDGSLATEGAPSRVVAADLDGDGRPDLIVADSGSPFASPPVSGAIRIYRNLGSTFAAPLVLSDDDAPSGLDVGDIDGDGHPDIVATGTSGTGMLYVYKGHGDGTFAPVQATALSVAFDSVLIADADGDGKADLTLGDCCGRTFGAFAKGDGHGGFAEPTVLLLAVSPTALLLSDLDRNGHPDLLMYGTGASQDMRVFMNTWTDEIFASGFEAP